MAFWRGGISVSAAAFSKSQEVTIGGSANSGGARTKDIVLRSVSDPAKTCIITVEQAAAQRVTVVVQDWANTGELCNAAGVVGRYDCDGTYSVQYYRQSRILEDRYPDGTGAINRRTEYRVGGVASRQQVNGQCGYSATIPVGIRINDPYTVDLTFTGATAYIDTPDDTLEYELGLGDNTVELHPDEEILYVALCVYNHFESGIGYVVKMLDVLTYPPRIIASESDSLPTNTGTCIQLMVSHTYSDGMAQYDVTFD